ncbi:MAG: polysaccharide deacetylase family protein [Candidatus Buchananbacteria bacterium]
MTKKTLLGLYLGLSLLTNQALLAWPTEVAITIDDAPTINTQAIVSTLAANSCSVTFFVIGEQLPKYYSALQQALANNCLIGNHTFDHPNITKLTDQQLVSQITTTEKLCQEYFGTKPIYFRPPAGRYNGANQLTLDRLGYQTVTWQVDSRDWQKPEKALACVTSQLAELTWPSIILLHDQTETLNYLPDLLAWLKQKNIQCVGLDKIISDRKKLTEKPLATNRKF